MGFMDEVGRALASNVERFGLEIDTYRHLGDTGPFSVGDIFDPTSNHIAIVTGDVDHEGSESVTEGEEDNSPVCRSDLDVISGGPFNEHGTDADNRVNGTWPGGANAKNTDVDGEACLRHASDPDWLEDGDPFRDGVSNQLHDVRIELHDHASDGCPAGEFLFQAWVWGNSDADNNCGTDPCNDVQNDFDDGSDDREPHVRLCIQANRAAGEADLEAVRFFLANGFPVRAGSSALRNDLSVADFRLGFTRVDGASKSDGGDDAAVAVIEENDVRSYLNLGTGNINTDQAYARDDTEGVNIFSDEGPFRLDENDGLGNDGVGANNLLDTIDPSNTGNYPDANGEYLNINEREKIVFEFDDLWARFTVNIRDFGDSDNGGYAGSDVERIRLRAFNGTSQIGNDIDVTTCDFNAGNAGTDRAMAINTDFGMDVSGGDRFDRVQVIPMPIDSEDPEAHTRVLVGGALACGQNRPCSFDRTDSSDNNRNYSEFRCHQLLTDRPSASGSGETDEIQPEAANSLMGLGDNVNENTTRSWIDFNNYPEDASDLDVQILSENGTIRSQDNNGETSVGFGVNGTGASGTLLDTIANPTGSETDVEELRFLFDQDWQRLNIGVTRFGLNSNGGNDQVQIAFHNDGNETAVHTLTLSPCAGADTNNNWRKDALIDVQSLASSVFDEVRVRPLVNTEPTGDRRTQVYIRSLKACDAISGCDLDYGDENAGQAARYCTESLS